MRRTKQRKSKAAPVTAADLAQSMMQCGAQFEFSNAGSLWVRNLATLPSVLIDDFMSIEQKAFVTAVRGLQSMPCSAMEVAR